MRELIEIPGICMETGDKHLIVGEYEIIRMNNREYCKLCHIQYNERCSKCSLGDKKDDLCKLRKAVINYQG